MDIGLDESSDGMASGSEAVDQLIRRGLLHEVSTEALQMRRPWYLPPPTPNISRSARTSSDLQREFGQEKWGSLLARLDLMRSPTVEDADLVYFGEEESIGCLGASLFSGKSIYLNEMYVAAISEILKNHTQGMDVVDLGAGYGSLCLRFLADDRLAIDSLTALEFTHEGRECLRILGSPFRGLKVGACDFFALGITDVLIEPGSIILTSMSNMYVNHDQKRVLTDIINWGPKIVFHFEPSMSNNESELGWERDRYMSENNYNTALLPTLRSLEAQGLLKVLEVREVVAGINAVLPVGFISWQPTTFTR